MSQWHPKRSNQRSALSHWPATCSIFRHAATLWRFPTFSGGTTVKKAQHCLIFPLVLVALACGASAMDPWKKMQQEVLANEKNQLWKQIDWQSDMETAMKAAKESGKPILVTIIVGEFGKKDAARC